MMNPMGRVLAWAVVFMTLALAGGAAEPRLEWTYDTKGKIYASPILSDLDGDGLTEVIVGASRARRVLCMDHEGAVRWEYQLEDGNSNGFQSTPSVADFNGDGVKEVVFLSCGGTLGRLDFRGKLVWRALVGGRVEYSGTVLADVDADGRLDILFGSESGTVYCYDDCGVEKWHYQGDGNIRGLSAVTKDAASGALRVYACFGAGGSVCLTSSGEPVWSFNEPSERRERRSGVAAGDLDGDGKVEVVVATHDGQFIVRDAATGEERWRWKARLGCDQTSSVALVDFDGSGKLDVVCGDGSGLGGTGHVYRVRDGKALWTTEVGGVVQGPSVGDVDGDGDLEILVCSRGKRIQCLSSSGEVEWSFQTEAGSLTTPALGDIDSDGKTEVVFTSKDRHVRCLEVPGEYHAERFPWPMLNRDPQLTGNAAGMPFQGTPPPRVSAEGLRLNVPELAPLRWGDNPIRFSYVNRARWPRQVEAVAEVSRPDSTFVTHSEVARVAAGEEKEVVFNLPVYATGSSAAAVPSPHDYRLRVRVVDLGTGETIAKSGPMGHMLHFDPWEEEKREWQAVVESTAKVARATESEAVRECANVAFRQAASEVGRALGGIELVSESFGSTGGCIAAVDRAFANAESATWSASLAERREWAQRVHRALREGARFRARVDACRATPGNDAEFAAVPVSSMVKVFRDEPLDAMHTPAHIALAGNERESMQFVVVPLWRDIKNLRVTVTGLAQSGGDGRIPSDSIQVNRVGYIPIGPSEYNWHVEKQGDYPDVLFPDAPYSVPAEQDAQPYYVTVYAPPETPAGDYTGEVRFEADGFPDVTLPLAVHVWGFSLSDETHLKTSMWMNETWLQRFYKLEGRPPFEMRKRFYDLHLEHRMSPIKDFPLNGEGKMDDFEYLIPNGQNCFFIPVPEWLEPGDREGLAARYRSTRDLLKSKGWNDLAMFYTRDEVAVMARHLIPEVVKMNAWAKTVIPEWPRLQTSAPELSLFGAVDIWCPCIDHFDPVVLEDRMKKGERLWFYTVWGRPGIMIEFPATDYRLMFWECWKYGAEGFLYWGTTHWDLNTITDKRWPEIPWISYNRQPGHHGCGYLVYPGPEGTPYASIRMALARDGIEDYEYFYLLNALSKGGKECPEYIAAEVREALAVNPGVVKSNEEFTDEPGVIMEERERIAELIEALIASQAK